MINPNIILSGRAPQVEGPMELYGKALTLKSLMQSQQMHTEQMKHYQMQTEAAERDAAEYDTFKQALGRGAKAEELYGISPKRAGEYVKSQSEQAKAVLDQQKTQAEILKTNNALVGQHAGAILNAAPEQQAAIYGAARQSLIGQGLVKAEEIPEQYDPAWVQTHYAASIEAGKQLEAHQKEIEQKQKELEYADKRPSVIAKTEQDVAESAQFQQYGMSKKDHDELERRKLPNTPTELAVVAADPNRSPEDRKVAQDALKTMEQHARASRPVTNNNYSGGVPGVSNQPTKLTGDEYLKTLPPAFAARVRSIAEGRDTLPAGRASTQGAGLQLANAVYAYDPGYSVQRGQIRKAFITGPDGRNVGALNTAIVHLGRLDEAAKALQNGSLRQGNELYNWVKDQFGSGAVSNFELIKDAVAGEMAAALKGNATDIEIANMKHAIRSSNSPEAMNSVIAEGMKILGDKANTYHERYQREMPGDSWSPILPSARSTLERYGLSQGVAQPRTTSSTPAATPAGSRGGYTPTAASGPKVGTVDSGYIFQGGNPADPKSWKKQ